MAQVLPILLLLGMSGIDVPLQSVFMPVVLLRRWGAMGVSWWAPQFSTSQEPHLEQTGPDRSPDTDKTTNFPSLSNQDMGTGYQEKFSSPDEKQLLNFSTLLGKSLLAHVGINISTVLFTACALASASVTLLYKKKLISEFFCLGVKNHS